MPIKVGPWCKHWQNNDMPETHICDAKFALLGEAPGRVENEVGKPFMGPSGYDLETWWKQVGLKRSDFYIDNCYPYQPPGNKLDAIVRSDLHASTQQMLMRLRCSVPYVFVLVPTGNTALRGLFQDGKRNITDWRGSILSWEGKKCIPTIHPAATQRQKVLTKLCVADWKRISEEGKFRELNLPKRNHIVDPDAQEMQMFWDIMADCFAFRYKEGKPPDVLSVDVENDRKTKKLLCIGFSFYPDYSITVSTVESDFENEEKFKEAQDFIQDVLNAPFPCVYQNGMTDVWKLSFAFPRCKDVLIRNYVWDLMEMAHCLDPNDGGDTTEGSEDETDEGVRVGMLDLATLQSLYTREPYHKWMSSHPSQEKRWVYNGLDACVQREIFDALWVRLKERGLV